MCGRSPCNSPSCDWSQDHMRSCEARFVLAMGAEARVAFVAKVTKVRGVDAAEGLKERVNTEWRKRREVAA